MFKRGGIVRDTSFFVVVFVAVSIVIDWFFSGKLRLPGLHILPGMVGAYLGFLVSRKFRKPNKAVESVKP